MPRFGPIGRPDLVRCFRRLGFEGPFPGAKHEIMQRGTVTVRLPNPHRSEIGVGLLVRLLRQAGVSREDWEKL